MPITDFGFAIMIGSDESSPTVASIDHAPMKRALWGGAGFVNLR
jgi:hypothetical protein